MVAAPPATPVTTPPPLTVANAVLLLDQLPPPGEPESVIVLPTQRSVPPVIVTFGNGVSVILIVFDVEVQVPLEAVRV